MSDDASRSATGEETSLLVRAYNAILNLVPLSSENEDGFAVFVLHDDLKNILVGELKISETAAKKLLKRLSDIKVYRSASGGRGKPWKRYLKMDAAELVAEADGSDGTEARTRGQRKPIEPEPASDLLPEGVPITPEQMDELLAKLSEKLDEYLEEKQALQLSNQELVTQLEESKNENVRLQQQLEEAQSQANRPVFVVPESLAKHLE